MRYLFGATSSQNVSSSTGSHSFSNTFLRSRSGNQRSCAANFPEWGLTPRVVCHQVGFMFWNQIPAEGPIHWANQDLTKAIFSSGVSTRPGIAGSSPKRAERLDLSRTDASARDWNP